MHRTDAHALAAILRAVNESEKNTLLQRWGEALGVHPAHGMLAKRHAEVVSLLTGTLDQIAALPEQKRQTYEPFTTAWWTAVVSPEVQWRSSFSSQVLSAEHLSLLNGVGDVVEARMDLTASVPGAFNLDQIADQVGEWLEALGDPTVLADPLRRSLIQGFTHVSWLIDNIGLFGAARVAKAANAVTGEVVQAIPHVRKDERRTWAARLAKWTATLAAYSTFITASVVAIEQTDQLIRVITDVATQVVDALEAGDGAQEGPVRPAITGESQES